MINPSSNALSLGALYFIDLSNLSNFFTYNLYENGYSFLCGIDYIDNCIIVSNGTNNYVQKLKF